MGIIWGSSALMVLLITSTSAPAVQQTDTATSAPTHNPPTDFIPAGTLVEIRIDEPVSSKTHKTGDWFSISLARPVLLDGLELLASGTGGRGQVVHAAKSGWGGKPGELILAARYLETPQGQLLLRGMKLGSTGKNNSTEAMAAGLVLTPLPFAISGTSAIIGTGHVATAKLVADLYPQQSARDEPAISSNEPKTEGK